MRTTGFSLSPVCCLVACLFVCLPVLSDVPDTRKEPYGHLWAVTLTNGDRIIGEVALPEKGDLKLTACFGSIGIVREFVANISPYKGALVRPYALKAERAQDTVYLRDGRVAGGVVQELMGGKLKLRTDSATLSLERENIKEITLSCKKEVQKDDRGTRDLPAAVIRLRDDSIITGRILEVGKKIARVRTPYLSGDAKIPSSCVDSLTFIGDWRGEVKKGYRTPEFSRSIPPENPFLQRDVGFIQGHVTTCGGKPLTGCLVFFYDAAAKRVYGEDNIFHMLTHSVDGRYASPPLKPGRYVVIAVDLSQQADGVVWAGLAPDVCVKTGEITTADLSMFWWYDMHPEFEKEALLVEAFQRAYQMRGERSDDWLKAHHDNLLDFEGW